MYFIISSKSIIFILRLSKYYLRACKEAELIKGGKNTIQTMDFKMQQRQQFGGEYNYNAKLEEKQEIRNDN